ncbi:hypothetical protein TcWFU_007789 [Taenia crassiceps]|uniref:Uncharacterized protein n=1 Tax=Taenia crassiceps TaxID=6207 RepID=A0ABR4QI04_9CEST
MGLSNPIWVLLVPLVCGLFASQILWMIYVLWLERPIVVNRKYIKEEGDDEDEAEIGNDAEGTKREGAKDVELGNLRNKEKKEIKEDGESERGAEQKAPPTPLRYKVQSSMVFAPILPLSLPNAQLKYPNSSGS